MQNLIGTGGIDTDDWPSETLGIYVNEWLTIIVDISNFGINEVDI